MDPHNNGIKNGDEPSAETPKFADKWIKFQFLGEVLQSTLVEIRYFWFESELSIW
jgi:centromere/kinetochore protein ZW10